MKRLLSLIFNSFAPLGIPLAWRQLTQDRKRFAAAIAGVTFGFVLMIFQMGLYTAALRQVVFPHSAMKGDLVITSRNFGFFYANRPFSRRILFQLLGIPGVVSVSPVLVDFVKWKNTDNGVENQIGILGVNPSQNPFIYPELTNQLHLLTGSENILFDRKSKEADFGKVPQAFSENGEVTSEVDHVRVRVKGLFSMGLTLAAPGHIVISDEGFSRILPQRTTNLINIGLVMVDPGVDQEEIRRRISDFLPKEVRIMTSSEFQKEEQHYWMSRTAIGFICVAGMMVGMFVGAIVVYQILYTDVTDHVREYATLKAMGLTDMFLFRLVMTEALILLAASVLPSTLICGVLFHITQLEAGMPTRLNVSELLIVYALAAMVCVFSGLLATRKLKTADPADIY